MDARGDSKNASRAKRPASHLDGISPGPRMDFQYPIALPGYGHLRKQQPARAYKMHAAGQLNLFQIGEFLHQLLHAVPREQHGQLRVLALAFAHHHRAFAILAVAHALPLLQS